MKPKKYKLGDPPEAMNRAMRIVTALLGYPNTLEELQFGEGEHEQNKADELAIRIMGLPGFSVAVIDHAVEIVKSRMKEGGAL